MYSRNGYKFIYVLTIQILLFFCFAHILNSHLQKILITKFTDRIPDLRAEDWYYHDIALVQYLEAMTHKYGADNLIAFTGNCVTYQDTRPTSQTFSVLSNSLLSLGPYPQKRIINISVKGTDSRYLYVSAKKSLDVGIRHIYQFVPTYTYYHSLYDTKYLPEASRYNMFRNNFNDLNVMFDFDIDNFRAGRHKNLSVESSTLRAFVTLAPWMAYPNLLKNDLFKKTPKFPVETRPHVANTANDMSESAQYGIGVLFDRVFLHFFSSYDSNANETLSKRTQTVDPQPSSTWEKGGIDNTGMKILRYASMIGHFETLVDLLRRHSNSIRFVLTPADEKRVKPKLKHGERLAEFTAERIAELAKERNLELYKDLVWMPPHYFGQDENIIFSVLGSWKVIDYIRNVDPFLKNLIPKFSVMRLPGIPGTQNQGFNSIVGKGGRLDYHPLPQSYYVVSTGPEHPTYLEAALPKKTFIKGSVIQHNGASSITLVRKNKKLEEWDLPKGGSFEILYEPTQLRIKIDGIEYIKSSVNDLSIRIGGSSKAKYSNFNVALDAAWYLEAGEVALD